MHDDNKLKIISVYNIITATTTILLKTMYQRKNLSNLIIFILWLLLCYWDKI